VAEDLHVLCPLHLERCVTRRHQEQVGLVSKHDQVPWDQLGANEGRKASKVNLAQLVLGDALGKLRRRCCRAAVAQVQLSQQGAHKVARSLERLRCLRVKLLDESLNP
jgi:hypothetical protein